MTKCSIGEVRFQWRIRDSLSQVCADVYLHRDPNTKAGQVKTEGPELERAYWSQEIPRKLPMRTRSSNRHIARSSAVVKSPSRSTSMSRSVCKSQDQGLEVR